MISIELTEEEVKILAALLPELPVTGTLRTLPTMLSKIANILDKLSRASGSLDASSPIMHSGE